MKKYYRIKIENIRTKEQRVYISLKQHGAPKGYKNLGGLGSFELPDNETIDFLHQETRLLKIY